MAPQKSQGSIMLPHTPVLQLTCSRMKKPSYVEPVIGWNEEDFNTGLVKFGVSHYAPPTVKKINAPKRPELTFTDELPDAAAPAALVLDAPDVLRLM